MYSKLKMLISAGAMAVSLAHAQGDGAADYIPLGKTNTLLPCESAADGWKLLHTTGSVKTFDDNFTEWISGNTTNTELPTSWAYRASDSAIYTTGSSTPDLRSQFTMDDFDFRLTYKNTGNDGIFYKMLTRGTEAWVTGIEFAIDNDVALQNKKVTAGSTYDMFAPNPEARLSYVPFSATSKWNTVRIVAKGDSVEQWHNNKRVTRFKFWDATWSAAMASSKWNGSQDLAQQTKGCKCRPTASYVGFQGDHSGVWSIKDIRINTNPATIKLGPVATSASSGNPCVVPTDVKTLQPGFRPSYAVEKLASGLRLDFANPDARRVDLLGMDGKLVTSVAVAPGSSTVLLPGRIRSGASILRIHGEASSQRVKIFVP